MKTVEDKIFSNDGRTENWEEIYKVSIFIKNVKDKDCWSPEKERFFRSVEAIALEKDADFKEVLIKNHISKYTFWGENMEEEMGKKLDEVFGKGRKNTQDEWCSKYEEWREREKG